jgi:hypothetical protein
MSSSQVEKSTRKLAQQAPQLVQAVICAEYRQMQKSDGLEVKSVL